MQGFNASVHVQGLIQNFAALRYQVSSAENTVGRLQEADSTHFLTSKVNH